MKEALEFVPKPFSLIVENLITKALSGDIRENIVVSNYV
jgi:hypothetical protein